MTITIGVISDTHDLLRPEAVSALKDSDLIIHAGDLADLHVIDTLSKYAPVHAVRGNMDGASPLLPLNDLVEIEGHLIYVLHEIEDLDLDPVAAGIEMVVFGHSHKPEIFQKDSVIYLNPGSAGPRRYSFPVTVAKILVNENGLYPEIVNIDA